MPMTKRLGAYSDIKAAFTTALEHSGGTLTFPSSGAARNWRQRAYYYRQLLGSANPEFDSLHLRHVGCMVEITMTQLDATFTTPKGEEVVVEVKATPAQPDEPDVLEDSLLADAMSLVRTNK